ncbi:hypothetical protein BC938DRAFT_475227 [Jimgerdemannia flammicorona]|uniref:Uncharacterized protein n=1 Tax=Jimgerdemannia flammicorona TaxID=994334 RepID=A0A433PYI9_9FUNG|nr:hypothetical protein BC938DRAFT_475227 [Jimgerdemannia flammicorona]
MFIHAEQFQQFLELGQGYHMARKDWEAMFRFTFWALERGGYVRSGSAVNLPDPLTSSDFIDKFLTLLASSRPGWEAQHGTSNTPIIIAFEFPAVVACFVKKAMEYYEAVCCVHSGSTRGDDGSGKNTVEQQTCLIPICAPRPPQPRPLPSRNGKTAARMSGGSVSTPSPVSAGSLLNQSSCPTSALDNNSKRRRVLSMDDLSSRFQASQKLETANAQSRNPVVSSKSVMNVNNLINTDNDETRDVKTKENAISGGKVDVTLNMLNKAQECLRFLEKLCKFQAAKGLNLAWEQVVRFIDLFAFTSSELSRLLERWNLPFDIANATLLTRAELGLSLWISETQLIERLPHQSFFDGRQQPSTQGNLQKALALYREITSRISSAWSRHKQEKQRQGRMTPSGDKREYDQAPAEEVTAKFETPYLFSFRVLYCIAVIYMLVGWNQVGFQ